jgi:hypothetical protein
MGRRGGGVRAAGVRTEERDRASEALVRCATQSRAGAGHACGEGKRCYPRNAGVETKVRERASDALGETRD